MRLVFPTDMMCFPLLKFWCSKRTSRSWPELPALTGKVRTPKQKGAQRRLSPLKGLHSAFSERGVTHERARGERA